MIRMSQLKRSPGLKWKLKKRRLPAVAEEAADLVPEVVVQEEEVVTPRREGFHLAEPVDVVLVAAAVVPGNGLPLC